MPKLSIVIPIYGVEKYVERCCVSVFEQTFKDFELILVNDCSKDESERIVLEVVEKYKHLSISTKYIKHDVNKGISAARETGTNAATGEYIVYIDSDDYIASDMLECMIAKANETEADVVYCDYYEIKNGELLFFDQSLKVSDSIDITSAMLRQEIIWCPWNKMFKRSLFSNYDIHWPVSVNIGEDLVVSTMLFFNSKKIVHINKALYFYNRDNAGSYLNIWSIKSCYQDIKAVELVEEFLKKESANSKLSNALIQTKLKAKYQILYSFNYELLNLVANTFNETNRYIFTYKKTTFYWKVIMYLAINKKSFLFYLSIKLISVLKKIRQRNHF